MKQTRNLKPASAILTTIFLLFGILVVSMIGIQIVMNGLAARRSQGASSKAFYASEAGVERALNLYKDGLIKKEDCKDESVDNINFGDIKCGDDSTDYRVNGGENFGSDSVGTFKVKEINSENIISLNSRGTFSTTNRELYVSFCLPDCSNNATEDGCGRNCN